MSTTAYRIENLSAIEAAQALKNFLDERNVVSVVDETNVGAVVKTDGENPMAKFEVINRDENVLIFVLNEQLIKNMFNVNNCTLKEAASPLGTNIVQAVQNLTQGIKSQKDIFDFIEHFCPKCKTHINVAGDFCTECGGKMPKEVEAVCPECNEPVNAGMKFCPDCGEAIEFREDDE